MMRPLKLAEFRRPRYLPLHFDYVL